MSVVPSFESVLLEVHKSLGLSGPKDKKKLVRHEKKLDSHDELVKSLADEIFSAIGLDELAKNDIAKNIFEARWFNQQIQNNTWTYGATQQQVVWFMAAYVYAPGFGRHVAYWNLEGATDKGMPGGEFWYLPSIKLVEGSHELAMPVATVIEWLLDLLGQPMDSVIYGLGGGSDESLKSKVAKVNADSIERVLYDWLGGKTIPRITNIEKYFAEGTELDFQGTLDISESWCIEESFDQCLNFLKCKGLVTPEQISAQISISNPEAIKEILHGENTSSEIKKTFVELIADRYAKPSLRIIRQRLLVARAFQDAYIRLGKFLQGEKFKQLCAEPEKNKVLQLIEIFKFTYNLTVEAYKRGGSIADQDEWFESKLPPWHQLGAFISILSSQKTNAPGWCSEALATQFFNISGSEELENHFEWDEESSKSIAMRNFKRFDRDNSETRLTAGLVQKINDSNAYIVLSSVNSFKVLRHLALSNKLNISQRIKALHRLYAVCTTPYEELTAICIELGQLLNSPDCKVRPVGSNLVVAGLINKAKDSAAYYAFESMILQYEAKHCIALKDYDKAQLLFDSALEACQSNGVGLIEGEIARDAFALKIFRKPNGFNLQNNEFYLRKMLAFNCFEGSVLQIVGPAVRPTVESVAVELEEHFAEYLNNPY